MIPSDNTLNKISGFKQQKKPHKALFIFYEDVECLMKRLDGCKTILTIHPQLKYVTLFHDPFQCLQYCYLKV